MLRDEGVIRLLPRRRGASQARTFPAPRVAYRGASSSAVGSGAHVVPATSSNAIANGSCSPSVQSSPVMSGARQLPKLLSKPAGGTHCCSLDLSCQRSSDHRLNETARTAASSASIAESHAKQPSAMRGLSLPRPSSRGVRQGGGHGGRAGWPPPASDRKLAQDGILEANTF